MGVLDAIRAFIDPSSLKPPLVRPFDQFRYPHFVVRVPHGKRAPKSCVISAADGVAEFIKIFPYATPDEVAAVSCAFDFGAPALQILPAY